MASQSMALYQARNLYRLVHSLKEFGFVETIYHYNC